MDLLPDNLKFFLRDFGATLVLVLSPILAKFGSPFFWSFCQWNVETFDDQAYFCAWGHPIRLINFYDFIEFTAFGFVGDYSVSIQFLYFYSSIGFPIFLRSYGVFWLFIGRRFYTIWVFSDIMYRIIYHIITFHVLRVLSVMRCQVYWKLPRKRDVH